MMSLILLIVFHVGISIGLLLFGAVGLMARKRKHSLHSRLGNVYFWLLTFSLSSGFIDGLFRHPGTFSVFQIVTPPTYALGLLGYLAVKRKPKAWLGKPWLYWHIVGESGSYIGVITATCFQTVPRVIPVFYHTHLLPMIILLFALPTVTGTILINITIPKWVKKPVVKQVA